MTRSIILTPAGAKMDALIARHVTPGYAVKWLSPLTVDKRGLRGWEPIIKGGELVKYRELILAQMPPKKKTARQEFFADLNEQQMGYTQRPAPCWFCKFKAWLGRVF